MELYSEFPTFEDKILSILALLEKLDSSLQEYFRISTSFNGRDLMNKNKIKTLEELQALPELDFAEINASDSITPSDGITNNLTPFGLLLR